MSKTTAFHFISQAEKLFAVLGNNKQWKTDDEVADPMICNNLGSILIASFSVRLEELFF
jgi:hypothetical protein